MTPFETPPVTPKINNILRSNERRVNTLRARVNDIFKL